MARDYFGQSHRILRQSIREFVNREILPHINEWEENEMFPTELFKKAGDAGILAIGFDEKYGGVDSDYFHSLVMTEELTRSGAQGIPAGLGSHGIGLPPIQAVGTEEQKQKYIPPVLAGDKICALAITEPNAGSDVASIQTKAVKKGDHYVVNGSKMFITSGIRADVVTTAVRTGGEGKGGISLLVMEPTMEGFSVSKKLKKIGWACSDTAELSFVDVKVPTANLLGQESEGFRTIMINFAKERLWLAAIAYTTGQIAFEHSLEYAKHRKVFGQPLINNPIIKHKLATMITKVVAAREYTYRVADKLKDNSYKTEEIAIAKNIAVEACDFAVNEAVQIHGGMGCMREVAVERLYRDSRILGIGGGTNEIMNEIICKSMGIG